MKAQTHSPGGYDCGCRYEVYEHKLAAASPLLHGHTARVECDFGRFVDGSYEEEDALNMRGNAEALRALALSRCGAWHRPIPDLVHATDAATISGFPVYDRTCTPCQSPAIETGPSGPKPPGQANAAEEARLGAVTLIGDASHPMSPFKGKMTTAQQAALYLINGAA